MSKRGVINDDGYVERQQEDLKVKLQFWDTAGAEQFRSLTGTYFKNAAAAIIVYDVTDKRTLENAKLWFDIVKENAPPDICICLCGNKIDLIESIEVPIEVGKEFAEFFGIYTFDEVSALKN